MAKIISTTGLTNVLNKIKSYIQSKLSSLVINSDQIADGAITEAKLDPSISIGGGLALNGILVRYLSSTPTSSGTFSLGEFNIEFGRYLLIIYVPSISSEYTKYYQIYLNDIKVTINGVSLQVSLINGGTKKYMTFTSSTSTVVCMIYDETGVSLYSQGSYNSSTGLLDGSAQFV